MRRGCLRATGLVSAPYVPPAKWNPAQKGDPRQMEDPMSVLVTMRRTWLPKQHLVGEDPWEMDANAAKEFSKRNLADQYTEKLRTCMSFLDAVPFYLEMAERGVPVTTSFANLFLSHALQFRSMMGGWKQEHTWNLYKQLMDGGAKADINTLDLMSLLLHNLCLDYCEEFQKKVVGKSEALNVAAMRKALLIMVDANIPDTTFLREDINGDSDVMKAQEYLKAAYKAAGEVAAKDLQAEEQKLNERLGSVEKAMLLFMKQERERRVINSRIEQEKGKEAVFGMELEERELDEKMGNCLQDIFAMGAVVEVSAFMSEITPAEIITGCVPRSTKTGMAIPERPMLEWECAIVMDPAMVEKRQLICTIRHHLVDEYNKLCREFLHREGEAIESMRLDKNSGQDRIEAILKRHLNSLRRLSQLPMTRVVVLRPEIISCLYLSPPQQQLYSAETHAVGCYIGNDRALVPEHRATLHPSVCRVAFSYFQPTYFIRDFSNYRRSGDNFDLLRFAETMDLLDAEDKRRFKSSSLVMPTEGTSDAYKSPVWRRRVNLDLTPSIVFIRRESARRDPSVAQAFATCLERISEQGASDWAGDQVWIVAQLALKYVHLWPNSRLYNALLTCAVGSQSHILRATIPRLVHDAVCNFDQLIDQVARDVGLLGPESGIKIHRLQHPVLLHSDSGVDSDYFALLMLSRPWRPNSELPDTKEVLIYFYKQLRIIEDRLKSVKKGHLEGLSTGAARWEHRRDCLTKSAAVYDAMLQIVYDEVSSQHQAVEESDVHKTVDTILREMKANDVQPSSEAYSIVLSLIRRFPALETHRDQLLHEMKGRGRRFWWQWFEEI